MEAYLAKIVMVTIILRYVIITCTEKFAAKVRFSLMEATVELLVKFLPWRKISAIRYTNI